MRPITNMFNEVQYELVKIILLNVFLSTVILFLIADLVALVFRMPLWYVIAVSGVYFLVVLIAELRKISLRVVEENNPDLREILRTAKDNQAEDTLMAHALFFDVMERMRRVSSGTFLDFKKLMMKIGTVFVLSIVLISLAFFDVDIARFDNPFARPFARFTGMFGGEIPDASGVEGAGDDVFGDASMAKLGSDQLIATVNPSLDSPDFSKIDPASPSSDPLAGLESEGDVGFQTGDAFNREGIDEKDLERSYKYAKDTQG